MIAQYLLKNGQILEIEQDLNSQNPNDWESGITLFFNHRQCFIKPKDIKFVDEAPDGYWKLAISAYIHSGVKLSLGRTSGWDSSNNGYVLISQKEFPDLIVATANVESFIDAWNTYLAGDVTVMMIYDVKVCECCKNESRELIECVGDFYGTDPKENGMEEYLPAEIEKQLK